MDDRPVARRIRRRGSVSASSSPSRGLALQGAEIPRVRLHPVRAGHTGPDALLLFYYGLNLFGIRVDAWTAAILAFTLSTSSFLAEIWRGCLQAVPLGQWDAARSLGLNFPRTLQLVIMPQAVRMALPPTVGYMVQVVKGTSLAALIGFTELAKAGTQINTITFEPIPSSARSRASISHLLAAVAAEPLSRTPAQGRSRAYPGDVTEATMSGRPREARPRPMAASDGDRPRREEIIVCETSD